MFAAYAQVSCGIAVSYLADGSGAGMNDLLEQNVDFAATDMPLTDGALARSQHGPILHIPVTLGAEAIIYHVPGVNVAVETHRASACRHLPGNDHLLE